MGTCCSVTNNSVCQLKQRDKKKKDSLQIRYLACGALLFTHKISWSFWKNPTKDKGHIKRWLLLICVVPVTHWTSPDMSHRHLSDVYTEPPCLLKEHSTFLKIGSFYNSPRVKQLSFTVFESIQPISGFGGSTFSLA